MKPRQPDEVVRTVRSLYPRPVKANDCDIENPSHYCVGGAWLLFRGHTEQHNRMPAPRLLADELSEATGMGLLNAWDWAQDITGANDRGEFDRAWSFLERALSGKHPQNVVAEELMEREK